jgi:hypothetical protein
MTRGWSETTIDKDMVYDYNWESLSAKKRTLTALTKLDEFFLWHAFVIPRRCAL